jgi:sarcosine oxidase
VTRFDTIVLGLGAMGSAAVYHLARRGKRVLGIDRFSPPHALGSSHGDTRITRLAIGEGAQYTPLAMRSHELWRELERESGASLLTTCGGLIISSAAKSSITHVEGFFANTVAAAEQYGIAHEILDAGEIRQRFPQFRVADDEAGYFEPSAGFLRPEECIRAHLRMAEAHGAIIHRDEAVSGYDVSNGSVVVTTSRERYSSARLIVAAGAWLPDLVDDRIAKCFKIYRQTMCWFDVQDSATLFDPYRFPVFIWELQGRKQGIYGFPALDGRHGGVKVSTEQYAVAVTADTADRTVSQAERAAMHAELIAPFLPAIGSQCLRASACLYTVTPDFGFVIDTHPSSDRVILVSPCSGHGFKHSPAIGEALAQLTGDDAVRPDLSAFSLARFERKPATNTTP